MEPGMSVVIDCTPSFFRRLATFKSLTVHTCHSKGGQVSQSDDPATRFFQVLHVGLKFLWVGVDPRVLYVRYPVKGHDGDLAVACLGHRLLELLERALWFSVEGLRHEQGIVFCRFVGSGSAAETQPRLEKLYQDFSLISLVNTARASGVKLSDSKSRK